MYLLTYPFTTPLNALLLMNNYYIFFKTWFFIDNNDNNLLIFTLVINSYCYHSHFIPRLIKEWEQLELSPSWISWTQGLMQEISWKIEFSHWEEVNFDIKALMPSSVSFKICIDFNLWVMLFVFISSHAGECRHH